MQLVWPTFTQGHIILRRNFLLVVCNYTNYQNMQKNSLPNPLAREKAEDKEGTLSVHAAQKTQSMSALRSQFVTQMRKCIYKTADKMVWLQTTSKKFLRSIML